MTVSLERVFIKYVLKNKRHFETIQPSFFKNPDIEFVYNVIRKWMIEHPEVDVPSPKQLFEMVHLEDKEGKISIDIFKAIFSADLSEYDEENFIKPKFNTWILINRIQEGTFNIIDETRSIGMVSEYDDAVEIANKLKSIIDDSTKLNFETDESLGSDFDDAEAHSQDHSQVKVRSGWNSLDAIMCGGWDVATLVMLLGPTNSGKSIFLQNIAIKAADEGYNVLYLTLEMSEKKTLKRMGAMRLKIPINDYDTVSLDKDFMNKKIKNLGKSSTGSDLFENEVGKLLVKFYAAGTSTLENFDKLIDDIQIKRGIKIQMIVVDYITLISPSKGVGDNLYQKGKHLSMGLRALGAKYNCPVITAMQVSKDAWGASTIELQNVSESKGMIEDSDLVWGIIRSEEMKRLNKYRLKLLKIRDGSFDRSNVGFDLNPNYLTLDNDVIYDNAQ